VRMQKGNIFIWHCCLSSRKSIEHLFSLLLSSTIYISGYSLEGACAYHLICQQKHQYMWMLSNMKAFFVDAVPVPKQRGKIGWWKPGRYFVHLRLLIKLLNCPLWMFLFHHAMQNIFCCLVPLMPVHLMIQPYLHESHCPHLKPLI